MDREIMNQYKQVKLLEDELDRKKLREAEVTPRHYVQNLKKQI